MSIANQIKKLAGESVVYGLSGVLVRFVSLLMLPLLSKALSPTEYGVMGMYTSTLFTIFMFVVFAMDSATYRYYFDSNNDEKVKKSTIATWYYFQLTTSLLLAVLLLLFKGPVSRFLFKGSEHSVVLAILMGGALLMYALPNVLEAWYRLQRKPWGAFFYSLVTAGLNIGLSAFCILYLKLGVIGFAIGQLSSFTLGSVYAIFVLRDWISPKYFSKKLLKHMIAYAFPLVPANIASQALSFYINYYLKSQLSFADAGLYYMGNTIASVIGLITAAVSQAWSPFSFSIANQANARKVFGLSLSAYVIFMCGICFGMMLFIPDLLKTFTNEKYYASAWVSSILIFNIFFTSTCVIGMTGCGIVKKTAPYAKAVVAAAIVTIILMFPLVHFLGKEGAAIALLLGQLIVPGYVFYVSQKYYPIPYEFRKLTIIIVISILLGISGRIFFDKLNIIVAFIAKTLLFMLFCLGVYKIYAKEFGALIIQIKGKLSEKKNLGNN